MLSEQKTNQSADYGSARSGGAATMMRSQCPKVRAARRSDGLLGGAGKQVMGVRTLVHMRRIAATALVASMIVGGLACAFSVGDTDRASVPGRRHPERPRYPERRRVLERDRCSGDPDRDPLPTAGLALYGLRPNRGV